MPPGGKSVPLRRAEGLEHLAGGIEGVEDEVGAGGRSEEKTGGQRGGRENRSWADRPRQATHGFPVGLGGSLPDQIQVAAEPADGSKIGHSYTRSGPPGGVRVEDTPCTPQAD